MSTKIYERTEDIFEKIDTEEKAYWLGFLYADGAIDKIKHSIRLGLSERDKQTVEDFKNFTGYTGPLYIDKYTRPPLNRSMYTCCIHSKKMTHDLIKNGAVPRKTFIITYPQTISSELDNHFIRGYFDGDGTIGNNFSLAGTYEFLEVVQEKLMVNCNLKKTKIFQPTKQKIHILTYGGSRQKCRIREWLYKDATVFMQRKKDKFDTISYKERTRKLKLSKPRIPLDEEKIISLYNQGRPAIEISKTIGSSHTRILRILRNHNILIRDRHEANKCKFDTLGDQIIELYNNKKSLREISELLGINRVTTTRILKDRGIEIKDVKFYNRSVLEDKKEEVGTLLREGYATKDLANKYGVTKAVVIKFLKRWDYFNNECRY